MAQEQGQGPAGPGLAIDPADPDVARVGSAYALASQEGMTPELATQILALADTTPEQVREATENLAYKTAQVRSVADARLAEERGIHDDITGKIDAATKEEAADYEALRGEQEKLLAAARGLNEQVGRIVAFFGLPAPAAVAEAQATAQPAEEEHGFGRFLNIFVERKEGDRDGHPAAPPPGQVTGEEPPIYDPQADVVRKVGILAGLIALPNKTAEQVLAMVRPQGIDARAIGAIVGAAHDIAARQTAQSAAIIALVEARHQEEVARLGAASSKENTQFDAIVKEHAAATVQVTTLDGQIAHLRQFFGFPEPAVARRSRGA
jgi:hypothetical protein